MKTICENQVHEVHQLAKTITFFFIDVFLKDAINPLQLFVEKRQFFNPNNQWLNNIIYH